MLPKAEDAESKVFYLRLKGDHYRYLCEITKEKDFEKNIDSTSSIPRISWMIFAIIRREMKWRNRREIISKNT